MLARSGLRARIRRSTAERRVSRALRGASRAFALAACAAFAACSRPSGALAAAAHRRDGYPGSPSADCAALAAMALTAAFDGSGDLAVTGGSRRPLTITMGRLDQWQWQSAVMQDV